MKGLGTLRRGLSLLLALALCLGMLPGMALAAENGTYRKVTEAPADWTGEYLLVYEAGTSEAYVFNGSSDELDSANNYVGAKIDGDTITADRAYSVTAEAVTDGYVLKAANGQYIYASSNNNMLSTSPNQATAARYPITFEVTSEGVDIELSSGPHMRFNAASDQMRFRYYKSSSYANQKAVSLYKLEEGGSQGGGDVTVIAAPQATPQAGEVESGTAITLTTATAGATIYYTLDDSDPMNSETRQVYSAEKQPTITGEVGATVTLKAVAVLGDVFSEVQTLSYTVKTETEPAATLMTEAPKAGDTVLIYYPEGKKVMSTTSYTYTGGSIDKAELVALDATVTNNQIGEIPENTAIFTVEADGDALKFKSDAGYLYLDGTHVRLVADGSQTHTSYELEETDGGWFIKSTTAEFSNKPQYLEFYSGYFTCYGMDTSNKSIYTFQFFEVGGEGGTEPEPEPEPEPSGPPIKEGDEIAIYLPSEQLVITTTVSSGMRLAGVTATLSDGKLTTSADNAVFTVAGNNEDGFTFSADGKYLTSGATGNSLTMEESVSQYSYWTLENSSADGWYIKNKNAKFGSNAQYIEYYSNFENFTTYGLGSADAYTFQFYPVTTGGGTTPEPGEAPFESGNTIVIYAPSNNMALSAAVKNNYYPVGVKVTVTSDTITGYGATEVWTVGGGESGWTFTSNSGKTLSMAGSYSSAYPGAGDNETWILEATGIADQYYVKNAVRGNYLFWDNEYDDWTTDPEKKTAVTFCVVEPPEEEPDVSGLEVRATPASGASVKEGDTIALTATTGATIYYTTDGTSPTTESTQYTAPIVLGSGVGQVPAPTDDKELVIKAFAVLAASGETEEQMGEVCTFTYQAPVSLGDYKLYFGQLHSHTDISDGAGTVEEAFNHAANEVDNLDFLAVTDHSNSFGNASSDTTEVSTGDIDLDKDMTALSNEWREGHEAADKATRESNGSFVGIYGFEMTWSDGFGHINTFNTPGYETRSDSQFGNKSGSTAGYQNYYDKLVEVEESLSQFNHPGTTFGDFQDFAFYDPQVDQRITLIEVGNGEGAIGSSGYFPSYEYYTRALDKGWHVAPTNNQDNHKGNWGDSNTARSVVLATALTEDAIYDAIRNYRVYATEDNDLSILYSLNGNAMGSILNKQGAVKITAQINDPTDSGDMKVEVIVNGGLVLDSQTLTGGSGTVTFNFDSNDYSYYYLRVTQADQNIAVTAPVWTGEGVNAGISKTECGTALVVKDEAVELSAELFNNSGSDMTVKSLTFSVDAADGSKKVIHTANLSEIGVNGVILSGGSDTVAFSHTFTQAGKVTVNVEMEAVIGETEYTFTGVLRLTVTDDSLVTRVLVDGTHWNDYVTGYYSDRMGNFTQLAAGMNAQVTIKQPGETITETDLEDVALLVISAPLKKDSGNNIPAGAAASTFSQEFISMVAEYAKEGGTVILCGLADYQDSSSGAPYCSTEQINPILEAMGSTLRLNDDEVLDDDTDYNGGASQTYRVYMDDFNMAAFPELFEGLQEGQCYSAYSGCSVSLGENGVALVRGSANCYSINSQTRPIDAEGKWDSGKAQGSTASGSYNAETAVVTKGNVVTLATEAVGQGRVYVAGTVFLSNFEISDSSNVDYGDASYVNKTIITNILSGLLEEQEPVDIAVARANEGGSVGTVYTVEGTVTAGNVEPNAFYDTIYIQDETGGINIYPVATTDGTFRVGQKVRVTGSWDTYNNDIELRCISIELIEDDETPIPPTELELSEVDYAKKGGLLVRVGGTVERVTEVNGAISTVTLTDGTNDLELLFNSYIGYSNESSPKIEEFVKVGAQISAVGVVYMDNSTLYIRVRDLSEVTNEGSGTPGGTVTVPTYTITNPAVTGGTVTVSPRSANRGRLVTLTVTPDEGYELASLTVTDGRGNIIALTDVGDGKYTFTMPASRVVVSAAFQLESLPFTDVAEGVWYYDAIAYVYHKGLMGGVSSTQFAPDSTLDRATLATILWRLAGEPVVNYLLPFEDVPEGEWYSEAIRWAASTGIVTGTTPTTFRPTQAVTREQMAAMVYRYAEHMGYDTTASSDMTGFTDGASVNGYAVTPMSWSVAEGLISGIGTEIRPQSTATRAQIATMLMRFCENVVK